MTLAAAAIFLSLSLLLLVLSFALTPVLLLSLQLWCLLCHASHEGGPTDDLCLGPLVQCCSAGDLSMSHGSSRIAAPSCRSCLSIYRRHKSSHKKKICTHAKQRWRYRIRILDNKTMNISFYFSNLFCLILWTSGFALSTQMMEAWRRVPYL